MNQDLQIVPSDSHIIISNLVTNPRLKIKQFQEEFLLGLMVFLIN